MICSRGKSVRLLTPESKAKGELIASIGEFEAFLLRGRVATGEVELGNLPTSILARPSRRGCKLIGESRSSALGCVRVRAMLCANSSRWEGDQGGLREKRSSGCVGYGSRSAKPRSEAWSRARRNKAAFFVLLALGRFSGFVPTPVRRRRLRAETSRSSTPTTRRSIGSS